MSGVGTSVIAWILLAISGLAIARMILDRFLMVLLYGRSRFQSCRAVTSLLGLSSKRIIAQRFIKWLLFWIGTVALVEHLQHSQSPWRDLGNIWLPLIALMVGCVQFFGQGRPAAILVLGASVPEALRVQEKLSKALFPHRPVSLLETGNDREDLSKIPGDCFRITFGQWKDAVWQFARSVLVIVVDMRTMTPAVDEELTFIVREQLQFKTILLKPGDQQLPDERLRTCCILETEEECAATVRQAFGSSFSLPSDHRPIQSLV